MTFFEFMKTILKKLTSIKLWICIWACWMISYVVVKQYTDFNTLALLLGSIPLSVIGANVALDYIWNRG